MSVASETVGPPAGRGVYCNRTLNLRSIKVIGYDMDYTLVHYRVEDWERRAYEHIRKRLESRGWPVGDLRFDADLVMRGLVIDVDNGNLLKANRFGYIKAAFHGSQRMTHEELRDNYMREIIDLSDSRFRFLNTLFALSEGCLYAQLVDRLDDGGLAAAVPSIRAGGALNAEHTGDAPVLGYRDLYNQLKKNVDATHTEGELKAEIIAEPQKYVLLDDETVLTLLDQKHAGKRLMMITNSEWSYTQAMMQYAVEPYLPKSMHWHELFELTVVAARKPSFFDSSAPLLQVVNDAGLLQPFQGPLEEHGRYFGGNAVTLEEHLGVSGDEILYFGDHMYGDVHVSKSVLRWRTGLILRELEDELLAVEESVEVQRQLASLMQQKEAVEWRYCQQRIQLQRLKAGYGPSSDAHEKQLTGRISELRKEAEALDAKIGPIAAKAGTAHNERWGLMLRAGNDKSRLARQIERYADVYTSRVSNLLHVTPYAYLRSRRGSLPHDVGGGR